MDSLSNVDFTHTPVRPDDLRRAEIFHELDDAELAKLARWFVELRVPADYTVIRAGQPAEAFYVVGSGRLAVYRDVVGQPVQLLAHLGRRDYFGEMGLFGIGKQSASVRAVEPSVLYRIVVTDLVTFLGRHPVIKRKLLATASYRYTANVAASLELARRREVRIGFQHEVVLGLEDGREHPAILLNLSLGGVSLEGAPEEWRPGQTIRFSLGLKTGRLELKGQVSWQRGGRVGLSFVKTHPNHDMLIQLTIRMLLESAS